MKSWVKDYIKPTLVGVSIAWVCAFTVWLFDMQKLMTQLVEQGKAANAFMERNERGISRNSEDIKDLGGKYYDHETRIKVIESKPAQGFSAQ